MGDALKEAFNTTGIIGLLVAGVILGILGRLLAPGEQKIPWWLTILAGIVGALIGNFLTALFKIDTSGTIDWLRYGLMVVGAVIAVLAAAAIWAKIKGGSRATT